MTGPDYYYHGGLAEIVDSPTKLSYSFIKDWFTSEGSIGKAMKIIGMPYNKTSHPLLEICNGDMAVNLKNEEEILYRNTVFRYLQPEDDYSSPVLKISFGKIFSLRNIKNSLIILSRQTEWISNQEKVLELAHKMNKEIPEDREFKDIGKLDEFLKSDVWPNVYVIGLLNEFFSAALIEGKNEGQKLKLNGYLDRKLAEMDWFFRSVSDMDLVSQKQITFTDYLKLYGIRADKDYELNFPRWHEIPEKIKERIKHHNVLIIKSDPEPEVPTKDKMLTTVLELRILRSDAKRKTLIYIDRLRSLILQKTKNKDISNLTKEKILNGDFSETAVDGKKDPLKTDNYLKNGKGIPVSAGEASGSVLNVQSADTIIPPGTIAVFPNPSPEFTTQFPKCTGIIFLKGGVTSHGSIVAREYGIPALVDTKAHIKDGILIELNGSTGDWRSI